MPSGLVVTVNSSAMAPIRMEYIALRKKVEMYVLERVSNMENANCMTYLPNSNRSTYLCHGMYVGESLRSSPSSCPRRRTTPTHLLWVYCWWRKGYVGVYVCMEAVVDQTADCGSSCVVIV